MSCSWKSSSTTSFRMGSSPEWCTPMPRTRRGSMLPRKGSSRSSSLRTAGQAHALPVQTVEAVEHCKQE